MALVGVPQINAKNTHTHTQYQEDEHRSRGRDENGLVFR